MGNGHKSARFEETVLVHLDAAYNFARRLAGDAQEAQDLVQETCLRAFRYYGSFRGGNARAWLLAIVRNTYYSSLDGKREQGLNDPLEEDTQETAAVDAPGQGIERMLEERDARVLVNRALDRLPLGFREVVVLRELEDLSYKEIAGIMDIPIGTVMSRLARARKLMLGHLQSMRKE